MEEQLWQTSSPPPPLPPFPNLLGSLIMTFADHLHGEVELAQAEEDARPHLEEGPGKEEEGVAGQYGGGTWRENLRLVV